LQESGDAGLPYGIVAAVFISTPTRGMHSPCWARAANGHAVAAPPSVAKNFRRAMWLAM